jgi:hypothetical protein
VSVYFGTPCYRSDPTLALGWAVAVSNALGLVGSKVSAPCSPFLTTSQAQLVADFLASRCTHLFFREDDVHIEADVLARMLATGWPAVVAPYLVRGTDRVETTVDDEGHVIAAGLGCALLERRVLEELSAKHDDELHYLQDGVRLVDLTAERFVDRPNGRQKMKGDAAFWSRVREAGFVVRVLEDVVVTHAGRISHFRPRELASDRETPIDGTKGAI